MIKENIYRVEDQETGNYCIYSGADINEAKNAILGDNDPETWDLIKNGERIWCGKIDTINELNRLN